MKHLAWKSIKIIWALGVTIALIVLGLANAKMGNSVDDLKADNQQLMADRDALLKANNDKHFKNVSDRTKYDDARYHMVDDRLKLIEKTMGTELLIDDVALPYQENRYTTKAVHEKNDNLIKRMDDIVKVYPHTQRSEAIANFKQAKKDVDGE